MAVVVLGSQPRSFEHKFKIPMDSKENDGRMYRALYFICLSGFKHPRVSTYFVSVFVLACGVLIVVVQRTPRIRRPREGLWARLAAAAGFAPVKLQLETKGRLVSRPPPKEIARKRLHKQALCFSSLGPATREDALRIPGRGMRCKAHTLGSTWALRHWRRGRCLAL